MRYAAAHPENVSALVLLEMGDEIPAAGRVIRANELLIDLDCKRIQTDEI